MKLYDAGSKQKTRTSILLLLLMLSFAWGTVTMAFNCYKKSSCSTAEVGYWPYFFMFGLPVFFLSIILYVNIKKKK